MRKAFSLLPVLAFLSVPALAADPVAAPPAEDGVLAKVASVRTSLVEDDKRLKPVLAADPRVGPLTKEVRQALQIRDKAERRRKLQTLIPRIAQVRADAIQKAGLVAKDLDAKAVAAQSTIIKQKLHDLPQPPPRPDTVISSVTIGPLPNTWGSKTDCTDSDDNYDFDGNLLKVHVVSAPTDADCGGVKAAKGAKVNVPAGTKKVSVSIRANVELHAAAAPFGIFAESRAFLGVLVSSASGAKISNGKPYATQELQSLHAEALGPLPFDLSDYEEEIQDGDPSSSVTFTLEKDPGPVLNVSVYIGGAADADLTGVAEMNGRIVHKSIKVTFYR